MHVGSGLNHFVPSCVNDRRNSTHLDPRFLFKQSSDMCSMQLQVRTHSHGVHALMLQEEQIQEHPQETHDSVNGY